MEMNREHQKDSYENIEFKIDEAIRIVISSLNTIKTMISKAIIK